jgi:stage IV sporulation protein FB
MSFRNTGPTGGIPVFSYRGVPVFVNMWFGVLALFFLIQSPQTPAWGAWGGLIVVICVVLAFLIHEFGHALMAKRYGLDAKILLHGMGGLCVHEKTKTQKSRFWVTAAGPLAGFAVAFGIKVLESVLSVIEPSLILTEVQPQVMGLSALGEFLYFLASFNMMWSLFNLIPLWPLDGGILFEVLVKRYKRGTSADKIVHGVGVGVAAVLLAYALSSGSILLALIAGMLGWENLQILQSSSGHGIRSTSGARPSGRKESPAIPGSTLATEYAQKAKQAMSEGRWREAARLMHQMRDQATLDPALSDLSYEILGCAYAKLEEYVDALDYLDKAPISPEVDAARAQCLEALGRTS